MTGRKSAVTLHFWHWPLFGAVQHMQQLRGKDLLQWQSRRDPEVADPVADPEVLRRIRGDLWLVRVLNKWSI